MPGQITATHEQPRFMQSIPPGEWKLAQGNSASAGQLIYANPEGQRVAVPNIWYNQPVEWNIEAMLFYARRAEEQAVRLEAEAANPPLGAEDPDWHRREHLHRAADARDVAARCLRLADRMQEEGIPLREDVSETQDAVDQEPELAPSI
ncbi:MAG: hypothetical protein KJS79_03535 [Rhodospirillales bacterium]|nr:hypothetical protein [Rhodospirillales bacterium]